MVTGVEVNKCTCSVSGHETLRNQAASWHEESCPRFANQCEFCRGEGVQYIRLSCECCTDVETCDVCGGTGNTPTPVTDEDVAK